MIEDLLPNITKCTSVSLSLSELPPVDRLVGPTEHKLDLLLEGGPHSLSITTEWSFQHSTYEDSIIVPLSPQIYSKLYPPMNAAIRFGAASLGRWYSETVDTYLRNGLERLSIKPTLKLSVDGLGYGLLRGTTQICSAICFISQSITFTEFLEMMSRACAVPGSVSWRKSY